MGGLTVSKKSDGPAEFFQVSIFEEKIFSQRDGPTPYSVSEMDKKYKDKGVTVALGKVNVNYAEGACLVEAKFNVACCIIERQILF